MYTMCTFRGNQEEQEEEEEEEKEEGGLFVQWYYKGNQESLLPLTLGQMARTKRQERGKEKGNKEK